MEKALIIQKQVQDILGTDDVYLVGGSVRDIVMGNTPKDYDFTTSMLPEEMKKRVKDAGRRVYTIGEKFGTIGFKVEYQKEKPQDRVSTNDPTFMKVFEYVEVTTFRSEVYTGKSRKPEVSFVTSLDEDLARRDFTMNAMVLRGDGTIYDPYGGKLDIYSKQIVTVGMPKDRIVEDPLRMLRAARFAARYGFDIDPNFTGKARQLADRIYDVSIERWVIELDKLFTSDHTYAGVDELHKMGILQRVLPELYSTETLHYPASHVNPFDCCGDIKKYDNADEAWKFLLSNVNSNQKVARFMNSGICQRFKFSVNRQKVILE